MLTRNTVDQLRHGKKRIDLHRVEKMMRGEHYSRTHIIDRPYTPDIIQHLLRYHWPWLESMSELDENIQTTFIDLGVAIEKLDDQEKEAVQLLVDGWATQGQFAAIAKKMGLRPPTVRQILNRAFVHIAENLGYDKKS